MPGGWAGHPMYWFFILQQKNRCHADAKKPAGLPNGANQPVLAMLTVPESSDYSFGWP